MRKRQFNLLISHGRRRKRHFIDQLFSVGSSILGGLGAMSSGSAAAAAAAAMLEAAAKIEDQTDEYQRDVRKDGRRYRKRVKNTLSTVRLLDGFENLEFNRANAITSFLNDARGMSEDAFGFMSNQKRSNADYALGGANENLRQAQVDFGKLAAGDTSAFNQMVQASSFGALAESAGLPMGAFANTSAKNMMNFRQLGAEGAMGISDFFAKQGTIDPINPLDSIFKLAEFERSENVRSKELDVFNRNLDFELRKFNTNTNLAKAEMKIGSEDSIFKTFADMEAKALDTYVDAYKFAAGAGGVAEMGQASALGGLGQAVGQIGSTLGSGGLSGITSGIQSAASGVGKFFGGLFN
jgi:hypothetical protein